MAAPESEDLRASPRVARWLAELRAAPVADARPDDSETLAVLARFAGFVGRTPDQMIDEVLDFEAGRVRAKGRRFYAAKIAEFEASLEGDARARREAANAVRSFFIHSGLFLGTPKAPWL